jgi:hypothetical protein
MLASERCVVQGHVARGRCERRDWVDKAQRCAVRRPNCLLPVEARRRRQAAAAVMPGMMQRGRIRNWSHRSCPGETALNGHKLCHPPVQPGAVAIPIYRKHLRKPQWQRSLCRRPNFGDNSNAVTTNFMRPIGTNATGRWLGLVATGVPLMEHPPPGPPSIRYKGCARHYVFRHDAPKNSALSRSPTSSALSLPSEVIHCFLMLSYVFNPRQRPRSALLR